MTADYALKTAYEKGKEALLRLNDPSALVISSDTIVELDGQILEKPTDVSYAKTILQSLSGRSHLIRTAVCILKLEQNMTIKETKSVETTTVTFDTLSDEIIDAYIETDKSMDKAGAYGIQGIAGFFVVRIEGCYYNVVGLPANRAMKMLIEAATC